MLFFFDEKKPYLYQRSNGVVAFELGGFYMLKDKTNTIFQFIRVSPKGYNFLNLKTGKCLLSGNLFVPKKLQNQCRSGVYVFDLSFRQNVQNLGMWFEPLAVNELPDVLLKIQSRQKTCHESRMAKRRTKNN